MSQTQQNPGIQNFPVGPPTVDVTGKAFYTPGTWGSKYPVRTLDAELFVTDTTGIRNFEGNVLGDKDGAFNIKSQFISYAFSSITLELSEPYSGGRISVPLYPGLIGPNQGHQNIGEFEIPVEPQHKELCWFNATPFVDTKSLAAAFIRVLRSPTYPISIHLLSESRGTVMENPMKDPNLSESTTRVTGVNGRTFNKPVEKRLPDEVREQNRRNEKILKESNERYRRPIPILTPSQRLIKSLNAPDINSKLAASIVDEIRDHEIVTRRRKTTYDAISGILGRFSSVSIKELENGHLLHSLNNSLQWAAKTRFHFDIVMEEAAADMAAACALIFIAGLAAKEKIRPVITFDYWYFFPTGPNSTEGRSYVMINIKVNRQN